MFKRHVPSRQSLKFLSSRVLTFSIQDDAAAVDEDDDDDDDDDDDAVAADDNDIEEEVEAAIAYDEGTAQGDSAFTGNTNVAC